MSGCRTGPWWQPLYLAAQQSLTHMQVNCCSRYCALSMLAGEHVCKTVTCLCRPGNWAALQCSLRFCTCRCRVDDG